MQTSLSDQPVVHFLVLFCGIRPGEILCHCAVDHLVPLAFFVVIDALCVPHGTHHLMRIVVCEAESSSCSLVLIVRLYGVFEAAGLADDRKGYVAEAHELGEYAWLKQGRHQEGIAGCIDLV